MQESTQLGKGRVPRYPELLLLCRDAILCARHL